MDLEKLLYLQGVGDSYRDLSGELCRTPMELRLALLAALNPDLALPTPETVTQRIEQLDAHPWQQVLPPFQLVMLSSPALILHLADAPRPVVLTRLGRPPLTLVPTPEDECGEYWHLGRRYLRYRVPLPPAWLEPDPGYLEATLDDGRSHHRTTLALVPQRAFQVPGHHWGLLLHLYRLRSRHQWGIGDFGDLNRLLPWLAGRGAAFIQLNPLAAPDYEMEGNLSPYAPGDRHTINPLYLEIEAIPEAGALANELRRPCWQGPRERLAESQWLEYTEVARLKFTLFDRIHRRFLALVKQGDGPRDRAFRAFRDHWESRLGPYCRSEHRWLWRHLQLEVHPELPLFLQFEARRQLTELQKRARAEGMAIGLVGDLPVGVPPDSAEAAAWGRLFVPRASIGAPPDPFAPQGQDWGLAPPDPIAIKQGEFGHWRSLLEAQMAQFGGVRLDHIMGQHRLWWCLNDEGGYVYYPDEALLGLLALESHRYRCEPTGEDLGLVPDRVRQQMQQMDIQGNQLLIFARDGEEFLPPQEHREACLFMTANHDVPPLAQWWSADDLHQREQLDLLDHTQRQELEITRARDKAALLRWITRHGPTPAEPLTTDSPWQPELMRLCLLTAARSRSRRFALQLDDLLLEQHPLNIPGTWREYPNWQRRHGRLLESIVQDPALTTLLNEINQIRIEENTPP